MAKLLTVQAPIRNDDAGSGEYRASRGAKAHDGVDYAIIPGSILLSPVSGKVSKYGLVYKSGLQYEYIEVKDINKFRHRFFYTNNFLVRPRDHVNIGDALGTVADITLRYPDQGMIPHVHYEIKNSKNEYVNPAEF